MKLRRCLFLVVILTVACRGERPIEPASAQFPPYEAVHLDGRQFTVQGSRGRAMLLNVWATWCGPCRHEVPELKLIQQRYGDRNFDVVGISVDTEEAIDQVRQFVRDQKINYPVVLDPQGRISAILNSPVLPTSALIDREGKVVWTKVGIVDSRDRELLAALKKIL